MRDLGARGEHEDWNRRGLLQRFGEFEAALSRHHHIDDQEVEGDAGELAARVGGGGGRRNSKAMRAQEAREQGANAHVIVDDQEMRRVIAKLIEPEGVRFLDHRSASCATSRAAVGRSGAFIMP
jgi:hypothetical protein